MGLYQPAPWQPPARRRFALSKAASSDAITITTPVSGRIVQHIANVGSITVTGTYTGTPTSIRAKIIPYGGGAAIGGFDWSTVVASPAGGAYTFTFTSVPKALAWYSVVVDFANNAAATATSAEFGVGELVAFCGQSNIEYPFTAGVSGGLTPSAYSRQYGYLITGWVLPDSAGPITAGNALVSGLGCVVGLIQRGAAGQGLSHWVGGGAGDQYNYTLADINAIGGKLCALVMQTGEADWDTGSYSATATHQAGLVSSLDTGFRADLGQSSLPIVIGTLGNYDGSSGASSSYDLVKKAQYNWAALSGNNYLVERIDAATGGLHTTTAGSITVFARYAQAILVAKGAATQWRGPSISRVARINSTTFDVRVTHHSGADISPSTAITGFTVIDPGAGNAAVSITTAARRSANTVRLTLASAPVALPVIRSLLGPAPTMTGIVRDDSTLALPIEWSDGVTAVAAATSATITLVDAANSPRASLSALKWAFFDETSPALFSAPTVKGSAETTDGSGVLVLDLTGTTLVPTEVGWLTITDSDGTTSQSPAHKAFSGPIAVA